jgi:mycothiol synthase
VSEFRPRPITRADVERVADLLAAVEAVDRTEEHYTVEDVLEEFENPMIEPAKDWLVVELDGHVVAHARLMPRAPANGAIKVAVDGTVHPAHRRRGIGSVLVPLVVGRAREYVRERGEELRAVVTGSAPSDNTDVAALFAREGLVPDRWTFVMLADLDRVLTQTPPATAPGLPDGYTLHTWEGLDPDEIRDAHNRAFSGHPGFSPWSPAMWDQWVAGSRSFRPALSLLARDATGAVAAYVQSSEYDGVEQATGVREAYVAKVGTVEPHRRQGLAGTLLRIALDRYRGEGFRRAALEVDSQNPAGALDVYERAGFRTVRRWTDYLLED